MSTPAIGADNYQAFEEASSPRIVAELNGTPYAVERFSLNLNAHGATSSADFTLPIDGNPDFSAQFADSDTNPVKVKILGGWPSGPAPTSPTDTSGLQQIYLGLLSQYDPDFAPRTVAMTCRSLASPMVDEKIQTIQTGMTTTDFIENVCAQFGLTPVFKLINAPLTVQEVLGAMYVGGANFAATVHGMRIWDLILQCAQFDNVDVWEDQGYLYYAAPSLISRPTIDLMYGRDIAKDGLSGSHALMFSKDAQVEVRTYQPRISQSFAVRWVTNGDGSVSVTKVTSTTTGSPVWGTPNIVTQRISSNGTTTTSSTTSRTTSGGGFSSGFTSQGTEATKQRYLYVLKNASPAAANAYATAKWRQISQREYTVQMKFPLTQAKGIIPLTALLRLHNVPYVNFNSDYYPSKITLSGGKDEAFMYSIDAINHVLAQGAV